MKRIFALMFVCLLFTLVLPVKSDASSLIEDDVGIVMTFDQSIHANFILIENQFCPVSGDVIILEALEVLNIGEMVITNYVITKSIEDEYYINNLQDQLLDVPNLDSSNKVKNNQTAYEEHILVNDAGYYLRC